MKKIAFLLYLISLNSFAHECEALVRNKKDKLKQSKVLLQDLRSETHFEGRWFKVVAGTSEKPLAFDSELALKACNVYYHLTVARNYFKDNFDLKNIYRLRQITIRLDINRGFSDTDHYFQEGFIQFFNDVMSVPRNGANKMSDVKSWNYELWFAKSKKIKRQSVVDKTLGVVTEGQVRTAMLTGAVEGTLATYIQQRFAGVEFSELEQQMFINSLLVSVGAIVVAPEIVKFVTSKLKKSVWLDTAMIPEVIYHEYTHLALSHKLKLGDKSLINEAIGNFFAADIGNTHAILRKVGKHSKGLISLSAKDRLKYEGWMNSPRYAHFHFGFKLMYDVQQVLGDEIGRKLIFETALKLNISDDIREDFITELFKTARELYPDKSRVINLKLHDLFQRLGL